MKHCLDHAVAYCSLSDGSPIIQLQPLPVPLRQDLSAARKYLYRLIYFLSFHTQRKGRGKRTKCASVYPSISPLASVVAVPVDRVNRKGKFQFVLWKKEFREKLLIWGGRSCLPNAAPLRQAIRCPFYGREVVGWAPHCQSQRIILAIIIRPHSSSSLITHIYFPTVPCRATIHLRNQRPLDFSPWTGCQRKHFTALATSHKFSCNNHVQR